MSIGRVATAVVAGALVLGLVVDIGLRWKLVRAARQSATGTAAQPGPTAPEAPIPVSAPEPSAAPPPPIAPRAAGVVLLDEMTKRDNAIDGPGLTGFWYTYSDGTGGVLPPPGSPHVDPIDFRGRRAREFAGHGQEKWGVGFGFDVARTGADPKAPHGLDVRAYSGIQFEVFSKASPIRLRVSFADVNTDPRGGVCDPKSTQTAVSCYGDFGVEIDVGAGAWVERTVYFSQLEMPAWSKLQAAKAHGFRKDAIYSVHFSLRPDQNKIPPFDVLIANVFLVP